MFRKILTLCMVICVFCTSFAGFVVVNGAEGLDAYFSVATGTESSSKISVTTTSSVKPGMVLNKKEYTWKVNNDNQSKILFDLDESMGNSAIDGSSYIIEIEYFDYSATISEDSFFSIWVDKLNYGMQRIQDVLLVGDGAWKKVTFEIDDAAFGHNTYSEADIMIRLYDKSAIRYDVASAMPLYFKSINVTRVPAKNPVLVESYIENVANTFEYTEEKQVINTFTNTRDSDVSLKAEYFLIDSIGDSKFAFTEKFIVPARKSVERIVTIDSTECGVFQWIVRVSDDTGEINSRFLEDTIVIVKTAEDGLKNEAAWIECHLERYRDNDNWNRLTEAQDTALQLINKGNIKGDRHETSWHMVEYNTEGKMNGLKFDGTYYASSAKHYEDYGIDYWVRLGNCAYGYREGEAYSDYDANRMPVTPEEVDAWERFCKYIIEIYANRGVELFEIWNEPNLAAFNPEGATPQQLEEITKRAKKAANELYNEGKIPNPVKIAGLSVTEVNKINTYDNWLKPAVDAGIAGGDTGMDVLNIHPYDHFKSTEEVKTYESVQKYRDYISQSAGVHNIPVLISEYGNVGGERQTEEEKSDWKIRTAILFRMYGMGEQFAIYNLAQKGPITNQYDDHYGIISPLMEELNVEGKIGIPTESYVAYAGMNYVLRGQVEPVEIVDCGDKININRLKRTTLGDEALALWMASGDGIITLDLGVNSVTYYDKFGNERSMTSRDGTYRIPLNESVSYITGDFEKVELVEAEQVFYDGFSDYTCDPWGAPEGWTLKSLSDSDRDDGTSLSAVSGTYGKSVSLGSSGSNGKFRHPALYNNAGYAVADGAPVRFHTDVKVEDNRGIMDKLSGVTVDGNNYHVAVSKASDIEDYIMGFKLIGESKKLSVYYWDEDENDFVKSSKTFDVDKFVSLDAVYYPEAKPKINSVPYSQTFDSASVIDNVADWTKTSTKWGSNWIEGLPVTYVEREEDRKGVFKATVTDSKWNQLRSPADFDIPVDDTTNYIDIMFDYKSEPTDNGTDVYTIVALRTDKLDRYTGFQIDEMTMYALGGDTRYQTSTQTFTDNVLGRWRSYKMRYYPHEGRMEVYTGDTQQTISDVPVLSTDLYTVQNGTTKLIWDSAVHGSKITGIGFQINHTNSNMYLDNVRAVSYSYADTNTEEKVEYYVDGTMVGEGKSGIGSGSSLETIMLASSTKASNGRFPIHFDNVCIMPENQEGILFEEMRHVNGGGKVEFKTTAVNPGGFNADAKIVTAFYDEENRLLDVVTTPVSLKGNFAEMSSGQKTLHDEGVQTRFYIWDEDGMKPLSPTYKVRNK